LASNELAIHISWFVLQSEKSVIIAYYPDRKSEKRSKKYLILYERIFYNLMNLRVPYVSEREFERSRVQTSAPRLAILTEVSRGLPQSHQENSEIVPQIRPQPLSSTFFTINLSPIIM
jgi:hypothetical protein